MNCLLVESIQERHSLAVTNSKALVEPDMGNITLSESYSKTVQFSKKWFVE